MAPDVDVLVDGGDRGCGELLLELHRRTRDLGDGARVRLVTTDPGAAADLPAWCTLTGHEFSGTTGLADGRVAYDVTISRRGT
ncbi:MAG: sulfurtransferase TusA family protein [Sporichthyaceae bacterium]